MRNRSLVLKLWLAVTALIIVVVVPLEFTLNRLLGQFYAQQVTEPLLYHSQQLAEMLRLDPAAIALAPMMGQMVGGEVMVLDEAGHPRPFAGGSAVPPPSAAVTALQQGLTFTGQYQSPDGHDYVVTGVPISPGGGSVLLLAPAEPVQRSLQVARRYLMLAGGAILLLGMGLALALARSLTRPILAMEEATQAIATGDFSVRVAAEGGDEIGRLGAAINAMTAQLETHESRRRQFLANVAHELRTPLSYIRGYTQALAEGLVTAPADRERYQRVVHDEAVRIGRLVDDLMDLAQMDVGQLAFAMADLDLHLPVDQAVATIRPQAEAKGVALTADLPASLPMVWADGGRVQQVVLNLLDNALRHTPVGGSISVTVRAEREGVRVTVTDTGEGIAPDLLPLLFERFQGRAAGGRGLGLAVVRSIIRAHGGEVGVTSRPGEGSTFWFWLGQHNDEGRQG